MRTLIVVPLLLVLGTAPDVFAETTSAEVEEFLVSGKIADGRAAMKKRVEAHPLDSEAQLAVGVFATLEAVENLAQNLHKYGLRRESPRLPFVRLPVPANPNPEKLTYVKWRLVIEEFIDDLAVADAELSQVDDAEVKLKLPIGKIRLDLNGDGEVEEDETFWKIFAAMAMRGAELDEKNQRFEIGFDMADVHWLIGYTHVLRAMSEAYLAYDTEEFFNNTAAVFFEGVDSPLDEVQAWQSSRFRDNIADLILAIHLVDFEVTEPQRMEAARQHLLTMISHSRLMWAYSIKETDDDREWIPNANQTSLTPLTVNQGRIDAWADFLDEAELVLEGEKLLPHWRFKDSHGINLRRVFTEPTRFDLVGWAHGVSVMPYVEEGELVSPAVSQRLGRTFGGQFLGFAFWFN